MSWRITREPVGQVESFSRVVDNTQAVCMPVTFRRLLTYRALVSLHNTLSSGVYVLLPVSYHSQFGLFRGIYGDFDKRKGIKIRCLSLVHFVGFPDGPAFEGSQSCTIILLMRYFPCD